MYIIWVRCVGQWHLVFHSESFDFTEIMRFLVNLKILRRYWRSYSAASQSIPNLEKGLDSIQWIIWKSLNCFYGIGHDQNKNIYQNQLSTWWQMTKKFSLQLRWERKGSNRSKIATQYFVLFYSFCYNNIWCCWRWVSYEDWVY